MTKRLLLTSLLALTAGGAMADEIRVLNWQGYGTDLDWATEAFTEATGHSVVHEYFTSEQEMLTKLRTNPGAYDVVLINAAFTRQAKDEGLIGPIDTSGMKNFDTVSESFKEGELVIDGDVYGVPWTWGLTSFAINTNAFEDAPDTIQVFWDPAHEGRVSIRDDALEAVQFGALATGQDVNEITDLDVVEAKLAELMPQIRTFWSSENDWNQFMAAGELDVATYWSGSAARSADMGLPVQFVVPKEGAVAWLDGLSVPDSSTKKEAAVAFIDWMIDPEFYVKWDAEGAPASANAAAAEALPDDSFNKQVLGDPEVVMRIQFQDPVDDATREKYLALWQGLKARQ
ncbi:ABC transporter substrate-binding protein [Tropicimonas isoalkanivorans]|uniref:Spermidine/putrescine transport system substrate-binding protein n=1 Tax=Tropicimonas isoalkanivorans TaxID=441112 RepID=A0A1I1LLS7_9RHOB|nr:extracellular solute-binding protein [Tropicimonas isoalkanivorans]SFC73512.1 spermidine/putrescine transport system substrate-binding protein [Tropicimonas isoalkanivorans]